jgi:hypothetical protein
VPAFPPTKPCGRASFASSAARRLSRTSGNIFNGGYCFSAVAPIC